MNALSVRLWRAIAYRAQWAALIIGLAMTSGCAVKPGELPAPVEMASAEERPWLWSFPLGGTAAEDIAFINVAVIPMDRERVLRGQTVLVRRGWITAIGPASQVRLPPGTQRIAGRGRYLIPGLGDCHAHISAGNYHDVVNPEPVFRHPYDTTAAKHKLFLYLANGVTALRNLDYLAQHGMLDGEAVLRLRHQARTGVLWSPRIYTSGSWAPKKIREVEPESVATYLTAYKNAGYDFVKVHDEPPEIFDSVVAVTRRLGLRVVGHLTFDQALRLGAGTSIEHSWWSNDLRLSRDASDTAVARWRSAIAARATAMRAAGIWNCPTMRHQRRSYQLVKVLHDAGVGLLLGTDLPAAPYRSDKFDKNIPGDAEMLRLGDQGMIHEELVDMVRAGLTPYEALAAGTKNLAAFLGTIDSNGTVAVGKQADLVLLAGNPLHDIRHTAEPTGVMIGGRWLGRDELDRRIAALRAYYAAEP